MAGERDAQQRLTEYSLRKVVDIARLYAGQEVFMEDLIGAGNEALLIAVTQLAPLEKPDEVDGYLGRRIMDAMEDLIAMNLDEKAAEKAVEERVNLVADRARELAQELGRKVSVQEVAAEYEMDPEDVREAVRLSGNAIGDIQ
jgi:RNA polymerase primary sigma factor